MAILARIQRRVENGVWEQRKSNPNISISTLRTCIVIPLLICDNIAAFCTSSVSALPAHVMQSRQVCPPSMLVLEWQQVVPELEIPSSELDPMPISMTRVPIYQDGPLFRFCFQVLHRAEAVFLADSPISIQPIQTYPKTCHSQVHLSDSRTAVKTSAQYVTTHPPRVLFQLSEVSQPFQHLSKHPSPPSLL
jgi:hypothetical protein